MIKIAPKCAYPPVVRLHFVTIPVFESDAAEAELNRFLAGHRVLAVDRQLVADGPRSAWTVCVSYVDRPVTASGAVPVVSPARRDRLQTGIDAALAITAHADARGWRVAELRRRRTVDA